MKFRTAVAIPAFDFTIEQSDKLLLMGSCFVEEMADFFRESGFRIDVNPFGTVYNPESLACCIRELSTGKQYALSDLFQYQGLYHSFSHHSRFSDPNPDTCLRKINDRITASSAFLREADVLVLTFGTAYIYNLASNGQTVVNCHKLPQNRFCRQCLSVEAITESWSRLIAEIRAVNPGIRLLFTVSPIRHLKDGAHENQLSKSILLLAIDNLVNQHPQCYYFPSYELLLDELRDYRFYADDMLHPSRTAVAYSWERFSETCFTAHTRERIAEWKAIQQALHHKPLHPESDAYLEFMKQTQERLNRFYRT